MFRRYIDHHTSFGEKRTALSDRTLPRELSCCRVVLCFRGQGYLVSPSFRSHPEWQDLLQKSALWAPLRLQPVTGRNQRLWKSTHEAESWTEVRSVGERHEPGADASREIPMMSEKASAETNFGTGEYEEPNGLRSMKVGDRPHIGTHSFMKDPKLAAAGGLAHRPSSSRDSDALSKIQPHEDPSSGGGRLTAERTGLVSPKCVLCRLKAKPGCSHRACKLCCRKLRLVASGGACIGEERERNRGTSSLIVGVFDDASCPAGGSVKARGALATAPQYMGASERRSNDTQVDEGRDSNRSDGEPLEESGAAEARQEGETAHAVYLNGQGMVAIPKGLRLAATCAVHRRRETVRGMQTTLEGTAGKPTTTPREATGTDASRNSDEQLGRELCSGLPPRVPDIPEQTSGGHGGPWRKREEGGESDTTEATLRFDSTFGGCTWIPWYAARVEGDTVRGGQETRRGRETLLVSGSAHNENLLCFWSSLVDSRSPPVYVSGKTLPLRSLYRKKASFLSTVSELSRPSGTRFGKQASDFSMLAWQPKGNSRIIWLVCQALNGFQR